MQVSRIGFRMEHPLTMGESKSGFSQYVPLGRKYSSEGNVGQEYFPLDSK